MGYRLSKIYTRTGDAGSTGLGDGSRTGKDSRRIAALGDVDELNSVIGLLLCEDLSGDIAELMTGGSRAAAYAHLARTICRRAERSVVALGHDEKISESGRQYLNRLSDLLFVLARTLNHGAGCGDVLWQKGKNA